MGEVTHLLQDWSRGDQAAFDRLFPLVYEELRRIARRYMRRERQEHTLQTTELVHEAYIRLAYGEGASPESRAHFFAIAAQVMRRVLIDHARSARRMKRGQGAQRLSLEEAAVVSENRLEALVAVDEALKRLEAFDARKGRVFELRFFGGMSMDEAAEVLSVSAVTAMRDWRMAKAWLAREISQG